MSTAKVLKVPAYKLFKVGDRVRATSENPFLDQLVKTGLDVGEVVGFGDQPHLIWVKPIPKPFSNRRGYRNSWHVTFWEKF